MKICDVCKGHDGKDTEVGPVTMELTISGWHWNHHTHGGIQDSWTLDLCPKCAKELKIKVGTVVDLIRSKQLGA